MKLRTLNEAVAELGTSRMRLRRGIQAGKYPCLQWGNRMLVDIDVLGPMLEAEDADSTIGVAECAERVGLSASTLRRMAQKGLIPCEMENNHYRFRLHDVESALKQMMNQSADD